jgi:hypothetical protein
MLPIDLQTIYTQLDKIGKTQVQSQVAAQAAQEAQIVENKNKTQQKLKTVQESEAGNESTGVVHERNSSESGAEAEFFQNPPKDGEQKRNDEDNEVKIEIITDPALGAHIDISG